jgi:hypothetical protein
MKAALTRVSSPCFEEITIRKRSPVLVHDVANVVVHTPSPKPVLQPAWSERAITWKCMWGTILQLGRVGLHIRKGWVTPILMLDA